MKNKYRLVIPALLLGVLMIGFVSAGDLRWTWCWRSSEDPGMMTCNVCQDNSNADKTNCKVVYHKLSWFEKKLINWYPWFGS